MSVLISIIQLVIPVLMYLLVLTSTIQLVVLLVSMYSLVLTSTT